MGRISNDCLIEISNLNGDPALGIGQWTQIPDMTVSDRAAAARAVFLYRPGPNAFGDWRRYQQIV
jgi:hypothetical protein